MNKAATGFANIDHLLKRDPVVLPEPDDDSPPAHWAGWLILTEPGRWADVAAALGYKNGNTACSAARQFALKHNFIVPTMRDKQVGRRKVVRERVRGVE